MILSAFFIKRFGYVNDAEAAKLAKAHEVLLSEAVGILYREGCRSDEYSDGYFSDIEEMCMLALEDNVQPPKFAWLTKARRFGLDATDILENALGEHHEGAGDELVAVDEFKAILAQWVAKQTLVSYSPDYTRYVLIPEEIRIAAKMEASE